LGLAAIGGNRSSALLDLAPMARANAELADAGSSGSPSIAWLKLNWVGV
jgi:hypothetical protein